MNAQLQPEPFTDFRLVIGGRLVEGASTFDVINPATERVLAKCPRADLAQLNQAVAAAKAAFPAWSATPLEDRRRLILRLADALSARADEFARLLTQEQGKPLAEAKGEVLAGATIIEWFADEALRVYGRIVPSRNLAAQAITCFPYFAISAAGSFEEMTDDG